METTMIQFDGVRKYFNGKMVLDQVSFVIQPGDIVGLVGPSGAGKTTILRLVADLIQPDAGQVQITQAQRISYVFQEPRLMPWRTALDNVAVAVRAAHIPHARSTAVYWLDQMELTAFKDYYPAQLSGGMQQRVALARALAVQPDLLLLDEPFSSLDDALKHRLLDLLRTTVQQNGITVVYATHILSELENLATSTIAIGGFSADHDTKNPPQAAGFQPLAVRRVSRGLQL
jgi:NitT/TauT family transport system ATP-binding protein